MTTTTPAQQQEIADYFAGRHIPSGLGTKEAAGSIAGINMALSGRLTNDTPDCMSLVIGRWILIVDVMPDAMRNSDKWRCLLPLAAGTGREQEYERLALILDWMWGTVLTTLQPLADAGGYDTEWRAMCTERTADAASAAGKAARLAGDGYVWSAAAAAEAAAHHATHALHPGRNAYALNDPYLVRMFTVTVAAFGNAAAAEAAGEAAFFAANALDPEQAASSAKSDAALATAKAEGADYAVCNALDVPARTTLRAAYRPDATTWVSFAPITLLRRLIAVQATKEGVETTTKVKVIVNANSDLEKADAVLNQAEADHHKAEATWLEAIAMPDDEPKELGQGDGRRGFPTPC